MTALVTGATGFVGGRLVARLLRDGRSVHALVRDRASAGSLGDAGAVLFEAELGDPNGIAAAAEGCAAVFHCAGENSHRADPAALAWVNVAGTENVINASRAAGVPALVHLSCADVTIDNADRLYAKESSAAATRGFNALMRTKLLADELALHANTPALGVTVLRPAWVWGPGDTTTLPRLLREALSGGMKMFGSGDNLIATTHVDNVVDALLSAETSEGGRGKALQIADYDHVTLSEFLGAISTALELPPPRRGIYPLAYALSGLRQALSLEGPWPLDVIRRGRGRMLEVQTAAAVLDCKPRVSIEQGVVSLVDWVREQGGVRAVAKLGRVPSSAATAAAAAEQQRAAEAAEASESPVN